MLNEYQEYILHRDLECLQIRHQLVGFQALLEHTQACLATLNKRHKQIQDKLDWYYSRIDACNELLSRLPGSAIAQHEVLITNPELVQPTDRKPVPVHVYKRRLVWLRDKRKENQGRVRKLQPYLLEDRDAIENLSKQEHQAVASIRKLKARLDKLKVPPGNLTQYNNEQRKSYTERRWYLVTPLRSTRGHPRVPDPVGDGGGGGGVHQGEQAGQCGAASGNERLDPGVVHQGGSR